MSVAKIAYRRGIGQALLERIKTESKDMGAIKLALDVCVPNVAAIALYKKVGFQQEGVLRKVFRDKKTGELIDEYAMGLFLDND